MMNYDVRQRRLHSLIALVTVAAVSAAGCAKRTEKLAPPEVSPASAAAKAMELYDADKDASLSKKELEKVPGILKVVGRYDADKDGKVSQGELQDRLEKFVNNQLGQMSYSCLVTMGGRPLQDAEVRFVPESFLEGMIQPAKGLTDAAGSAVMTLDPALAAPGSVLGLGVQWGIYKIQVSHPSARIPDRFGANSTVGLEISPIDLTDPPYTQVDIKGR
jgi:hypothetical protein